MLAKALLKSPALVLPRIRKDRVSTLLFSFIAITFSQVSLGAVYYVRNDGGTNTQCTGLADNAYPGTGTNQACALNHPFWLLPPTGAAIFQGGDTLIISPGEYRIGIGAPNTSGCSTSWAYDCTLTTIPPGLNSTTPTRILGKGWDTRTGAKPVLFGSQRVWQVLSLGGSNIELRWLDITDHSSCIYNNPDPTKRCNRDSYPYGDQGDIGISAKGGSNVYIKDVNVHGLSSTGFKVGGVSDWTLEDVSIRGNGFVGWDGDVGTGSSNSGTMIFRRVKIEYNGCGETYPDFNIWGCFSQDQGGYGDGLGTASTGGNWIIDNSEFSHNTSDGLDLLYHNGNGTIQITRSRFEGNAGNQVKMSTTTNIENSIIVGNCDYFKGKSFTETTGAQFNHCRAAGTAIANAFGKPRAVTTIVASSIYGNGDVLFMSSGTGCDGTEKIVSRNNIYMGDSDFTSGNPPIEKSAFYYAAGATGNGDGPCGTLTIDNKDGIVYNVKSSSCPNSDNVLCLDPLYQGPLSGNSYGMTLQANSPAMAKSSSLPNQLVLGSTLIPTTDFTGAARTATSITWGAFEASSINSTANLSGTANSSIQAPTNLRIMSQ